ncbi:Stealth CR1 domain-containing protein [Lactobacillus delbrueckii]|uniref:Stealth CR1 domain-containing protein n=1 Tax=Lactobacillus delbrueckii TaxID=1584 RepID=UPI001F1EB4D2|nr:Stealth CR1 domain-containing protein [Lactobacillus delbrueckii]GHN53969.1 glycosyltransferase [Lactobacillus delbrueckii]
MPEKIDAVFLWVDSADPAWRAKKVQYLPAKARESSTSDIRYRDYGTLKYAFRSLEKFAPWLNQIFLITDQQVPEWLNTANSKIKIIDHSEIIDQKYLPVFNSSVIEMNIDKIPGLAEHFIYFNDDMILNRPLSPEDFFKDGQPCDDRIYKPIVPLEDFDHILINNGILLNRYLDGRWPLSKKGIFSPKYGSTLFRNLLVLPYLKKSGVPGYVEPHGPLSLKKSSFALAKKIWPEEIAENNTHRFREYNDVTIWLVRHLQLERGEFHPRDAKFNRFLRLNQTEEIKKTLEGQRNGAICINDKAVDDYDTCARKVDEYLEKKFPEKSNFEK